MRLLSRTEAICISFESTQLTKTDSRLSVRQAEPGCFLLATKIGREQKVSLCRAFSGTSLYRLTGPENNNR